jgi:hypothetical protein
MEGKQSNRVVILPQAFRKSPSDSDRTLHAFEKAARSRFSLANVI